MKRLSTKLLALSLLSLMCIGAYAYDKDLKEHITISNDLMVGNTTLKKGDYLVRFNAATSQVSFLNVNKNEIMATAMATVTVNDKKAESDALYTRATLEGEKLTRLRLGGKREELALVEPVVLPTVELIEINQEFWPCGDCDETLPTCDWVPIPLSDDMEEVVISEVDGILPDATITNYKLVCQPW